MRVDLLTLFPEMSTAITAYGVTGRAVRNGLLELHNWNLRDFTSNRHETVDSRPYGGGPGMVMRVEPLRRALRSACAEDSREPMVIALSASGRPMTAKLVAELALRSRLVLIAGRYAGIDQRVLDRDVDLEVSVGDVVLSGGELPALMLVDAVCRLLPGALGNADSAADDAFNRGLLDYPRYTRPVEFEGDRVPQVLLEGNHLAIALWREQMALENTRYRRPDLLSQEPTADRGLELEGSGGENGDLCGSRERREVSEEGKP